MFDGLFVNYTDHLELPGKRLVGAAAPRSHFAPDEVEAAVRVLQSGKTNYRTGNEGQHSEREFADLAGWNCDRIIESIYEAGKFCQSGSCSEVYLEKAFETSGFTPEERLRVARELGETSLMFLVHPTLSRQDTVETCDVVDQVMRRASRNASHGPVFLR